jgi:glucokinase
VYGFCFDTLDQYGVAAREPALSPRIDHGPASYRSRAVPAQELVIGVDVGGTKIAAGAVDRRGAVTARSERPTPTSSEEALLSALDEMVEQVSETVGGVEALGFGIPSTIDQRAGRAIASVHIPLTGIELRKRMGERFKLPVAIDNDANAAAIAEWKLGAGSGARDMVMLTLGTGIGGGLILDGKPYRGWIGAGAELGHMVLKYDGPPCIGTCPGRGHFEALCSGTAADAVARSVMSEDATGHDLVRLAGDGDARATEALAGLGRILGAGLASLVNVFNPEVIVLGGGFGEAGELLFAPAREVVATEALAPARDLVRIVPAQLGPEAGLIGAGLIAYEMLDS